MKRLLMLLLCICLSTGFMHLAVMGAPSWPSGVSIQADGGILMDADTGTILYGKNENQQYYPASITKLLTALIVMERCSLDEMVSFSHDDVYNVEAGSSSAGIDEGDVLTVRDCLYALMLASANESANALACHIAGTREDFAKLMNEKAKSLGCTGSNFANPSGLNDENHYTTAHDMALIAREIIKNPEFLTINNTRSYQLAPTKRSPEGGYVANHHKMLNKNESVYYPGAFAGKTGYTSLAGNTLVTCAKNNGMTLIAVVLNGHQSHYADTKAMFDFGFRNFHSFRAVDYETKYRSLENDMTIGGMTAQNSISLLLDPEGRVVIPKDADFKDTESTLTFELSGQYPNDAVACIHYTYNGRDTGSVYLRTGAAEPAPEPIAAPATPAQAANPGPGGEIPAESSPKAAPASKAPTKPDITSKKGTASSIRIPANAWTIAGIIVSLSLIVAVVAAVKIHVRKKEEMDLLLRRQRRLERLEDIGCSSTDFDQLMAERRVSSSTAGKNQKNRRSRRKKSFFR